MSIATATIQPQFSARLHKFMLRPQRHRLLHGYPLAAAMPRATPLERSLTVEGDAAFVFPHPKQRDLLVGVLPHPFCNPKIRGCGYCTFPHESFSRLKSAAVTKAVIQEIQQRLALQPELRNASVSGLYFGGGTANLSPTEPFRMLARTLDAAFDLTHAEISLEGVPSKFVPSRFRKGESLLIDVMQQELSARHFRISMGMQTFSESRLEKMGRLAFGRPKVFGEVVKQAHGRGMTVSGDLMFNLPSQTLREMLDDVQKAIDIGLDQICLYHLVMFEGLGTVWSRDQEMLAGLPSNEDGADNWMLLRELLLESGYRQTSLTNFERVELKDDPRRYRYEPISYESIDAQVLGFGPAGISYLADSNLQHALKTMNPESSAEYMQSVQSPLATWDRLFRYDQQDLELLYFTRRLAALSIDKASFSNAFSESSWTRYLEKFSLLVSEGLLAESPQAYGVTPRGMFFSDSIAALLADGQLPGDRVRQNPDRGGPKIDREEPRVHRTTQNVVYNDNSQGHM